MVRVRLRVSGCSWLIEHRLMEHGVRRNSVTETTSSGSPARCAALQNCTAISAWAVLENRRIT
jgi:hypothetical protein